MKGFTYEETNQILKIYANPDLSIGEIKIDETNKIISIWSERQECIDMILENLQAVNESW